MSSRQTPCKSPCRCCLSNLVALCERCSATCQRRRSCSPEGLLEDGLQITAVLRGRWLVDDLQMGRADLVILSRSLHDRADSVSVPPYAYDPATPRTPRLVRCGRCRPGERANTQLKTWHIPRKTRLLPVEGRADRQGQPRPPDPRDRRMKNAHSRRTLTDGVPGHVTLVLARRCSPWRPQSEPTASPNAVTDGSGEADMRRAS
jgi:hypothetical protein